MRVRRACIALATLWLLVGCIPQVAPPYREPAYPPPPPVRDDRYTRQTDDRYPPPEDDRYAPPQDDRVTTLPAPPPAWKARPVTPDATTIPAGTYVVQPGDT
ncbi:MAG: hypothetical protein M3R41_08605, partial [Pseudomonadota bacterium]|nr:hypothetical protein [Pseudomonadota bacterium]